MNDKNEIVGYDVDIAQKLGAMLGVPVELVTVGSPDRVPFVATGKVDIVMGALTRNARPRQGDRLHGADPDRGAERADDRGQALHDLEGSEQAQT